MTRPTDSPVPSPPADVASTTGMTADVVTVEPAMVDGVDVDAVARAVRACVGVADLYVGRFGEIGSYLPGRRVGGVQVDDTAVTVHIKARWGHSTRDLLAQTSAVTVALRHGRRLDLVVDDIDHDLTGASDTTDTAVNAVTAVAPPLAIEPAAVDTTEPALNSPPS